MTKTMTYTMALDNAIALFSQGGQIDTEDKETVEKLEALKAQLAKRSSGSKGLTKTQKQNEVIKEMIKDILSEAEKPIGMVTLIADPRLPDGMSTQKLGALIRQMIQDGIVEKSKDKKHVVYTLVTEQ